MPAAASQSVLLASAGPTAALAGQTSQAALLAITGLPESRYVTESQSAVLLAYDKPSAPVPAASQMVMLVSYRTDVVANYRQRAWGFTLDGHPFYVLSLSTEGTLVYDVSTQQWAAWETAGWGGLWNMEYGTEWNNEVVAGDHQNPIVWKIDKDSFLDEGFKPIVRKVTTGYPVTGRSWVSMGRFSLQAMPESGIDSDNRYVKLSISRNNGESYSLLPDTVTLTSSGAIEAQWRSLGSTAAPGAVFVIEDDGLVRLDGAELLTNEPATAPKSG